MHAKCALALVLVLQVSLGLCEIPPPSQELVDKYNNMKAIFYRRLLNAYNKLQAEVAPMIPDQSEFPVAKEYIDAVEANRNYQAAVKVAGAAFAELEPLMDQMRAKVLGTYESYLRPGFGQILDDAINNIKPVLDNYMPAE